jgi:DNA replication protein DnaC
MTNQDAFTQTITKTTQTPYDYHYLLQHASKQGKDLYGRDFTLHDADLPVVDRLLAYFLRDEPVAAALDMDLSKGILLTGPVGCGKTSLLRVMSLFSQAAHKPVFRSCNEIVIDFNTNGYNALAPYTKNAFQPYSPTPRVHCFDDLGLEPTGNYYGASCNVMAEILLSRYNFFTTRRMITHVTTNMESSELENIYGNRLRSRMREMFNLVAFTNNSPDKRK